MDAVKSETAKKMLHKVSKCLFGVGRKGPGQIYIVKKYNEPVCKVGLSCNVEERKKALQTGNDTPLILAVVYNVRNMQEAEKEAHAAVNFLSRKNNYPEFPGWRTEWYNVPGSGGLGKFDDIVTEALGKLLINKEIKADFNEI